MVTSIIEHGEGVPWRAHAKVYPGEITPCSRSCVKGIYWGKGEKSEDLGRDRGKQVDMETGRQMGAEP